MAERKSSVGLHSVTRELRSLRGLDTVTWGCDRESVVLDGLVAAVGFGFEVHVDVRAVVRFHPDVHVHGVSVECEEENGANNDTLEENSRLIVKE